ncbi:5'-nucleotidase domain-containing protein 1 [Ambystoma mexicanum]|uniref:5'-nucleotidase domain-containing protein 1 n=1 Tax=Ambystoma mexicanum TaxID=8296 RepID=UPI0037E835D6
MANFFSLSDCDVIAFDLDHTLCRYNLREASRLIYDSFAEFLVSERGFNNDLLDPTPESWDFCSKGLVLDLEEGNLLKLAGDGAVLRASHGTESLSTEEIFKLYGQKREWKHFKTISEAFARSAKYYFYDNYFDLPGALLCARIVDCLGQNRGPKKYDFWTDVIAAISHNYLSSAFKENSGFYFPAVKSDPGKYVQSCPESVRSWMGKLKAAGKILVLLTSSHSDYCRLLCEQIFGNNFEEMFEIIITNALKPGFFSHFPQQRPFRTLDKDEEHEVLQSLEKPGWYSQGNRTHLCDLLKKMTGKPEPKVVYFGDSMRSDIFSAHHYSNWETVLILEELVEAGVKEEDTEMESLKKKVKYETEEPKALYSASKQWGSLFVDNLSSGSNGVETFVPTWFCTCIRNYSTIAIPSIEAIADLPLDHKFTRFSDSGSLTDGYYPEGPQELRQLKEPVAAD